MYQDEQLHKLPLDELEYLNHLDNLITLLIKDIAYLLGYQKKLNDLGKTQIK
jgi:hypothetical protein